MALLRVTQDFFLYSTGVWRPWPAAPRVGVLALRLTGWGRTDQGGACIRQCIFCYSLLIPRTVLGGRAGLGERLGRDRNCEDPPRGEHSRGGGVRHGRLAEAGQAGSEEEAAQSKTAWLAWTKRQRDKKGGHKKSRINQVCMTELQMCGIKDDFVSKRLVHRARISGKSCKKTGAKQIQHTN